MEYNCSYTLENGRKISWSCEMYLIDYAKDFYELSLTGKGSYFHVIVGPHENGHFICIPNWQVGCEPGSYDDRFWNREQLIHQLNPVDTETVVAGIAQLVST